MAVFDPTQGFNAFAAGAQIGGNIRKSQTQRAVAPMLANNDYEGAMKYVAGRGDLEAMDYIRPMQEKAAENAFSQKIGGMIASGDRKGAAATAYGAGKFEIGAQIEAQISQMTKEQRETAAYVTQQIAGVGMSLLEVKDPAQRVALWQQKQQELAALGMDPQQLAQFDPLNDALIESKIGEAQTIGQRLEAARWQQSFDREGNWRAEDVQHRNQQSELERQKFDWQKGTDARDFQAGQQRWEAEFGLKEAEAAREAAGGGKREMRQDSKGLWRYVDDGSPVFPDDKAVAKPLIGAESMGRVAGGLPNMRAAVDDLKAALGISSTNGQYSADPQGYRPGQDWGALTLDQIPLVGDVMARGAGGEDYQKFDNAYSSFEAAALPILSGAAVTDTEAKRTLRSLRVRIGDSDEAVARKMANMERMVMGLEAAARGDTAALQAIVGEVNSQGNVGGEDDDLPPGFVLVP